MVLEISKLAEKSKLNKAGEDYKRGQVSWTISLLEAIEESVCLTFTTKYGHFWQTFQKWSFLPHLISLFLE